MLQKRSIFLLVRDQLQIKKKMKRDLESLLPISKEGPDLDVPRVQWISKFVRRFLKGPSDWVFVARSTTNSLGKKSRFTLDLALDCKKG